MRMTTCSKGKEVVIFESANRKAGKTGRGRIYLFKKSFFALCMGIVFFELTILADLVGTALFPKGEHQSTAKKETSASDRKLLSKNPEFVTVIMLSPTPTQNPVIVAKNFALVSSFDHVYQAAGAKYGVPWQILYGLHLTESGLRDGAISNYEGSGAQGPMQFMPGTWKAYGVDGNGDGIADINNAVDAVYSAAYFIFRHGSVERGLQRYMGNTSGVLAAAYARGYTK